MHPSIIEVRHAQLRMSNADDPSITRVHELRRAHSSDLELEDHGWRECKCEPRRYVTDVETGSIRFDSIPTCDGSLEIAGIGRAWGRARVCQSVEISGVGGP